MQKARHSIRKAGLFHIAAGAKLPGRTSNGKKYRPAGAGQPAQRRVRAFAAVGSRRTALQPRSKKRAARHEAGRKIRLGFWAHTWRPAREICHWLCFKFRRPARKIRQNAAGSRTCLSYRSLVTRIWQRGCQRCTYTLENASGPARAPVPGGNNPPALTAAAERPAAFQGGMPARAAGPPLCAP